MDGQTQDVGCRLLDLIDRRVGRRWACSAAVLSGVFVGGGVCGARGVCLCVCGQAGACLNIVLLWSWDCTVILSLDGLQMQSFF